MNDSQGDANLQIHVQSHVPLQSSISVRATMASLHLVSCLVITREEVPQRRHTKAAKACLIAI